MNRQLRRLICIVVLLSFVLTLCVAVVGCAKKPAEKAGTTGPGKMMPGKAGPPAPGKTAPAPPPVPPPGK